MHFFTEHIGVLIWISAFNDMKQLLNNMKQTAILQISSTSSVQYLRSACKEESIKLIGKEK